MSANVSFVAGTTWARYVGRPRTFSRGRALSGRNAVRPTRPRAIKQRLSWPIAIMLTALVFFSFSEISPLLLPRVLSGIGQQALTLSLWVVLSVVLAASPRITSIGEADFVLIGLFYAVPIFSVLWSENPAASLPKCTALAISTVSVWVCASRLSVRDYAACSCMGLLLLLALSTVLILFVPEIGLMHTWEHAGVWTGIFNQKQSLGIAAAVLAWLSINLFFYTGRKLFVFAIALSFVVAFGSESRGGAAALVIGLVASVCMWRIRPAGFRQWIAAIPFLVLCGVTILIISLLATGGNSMEMFGFDFDVNSRTFIWQTGLQHWGNAPFLGTGLDAFWHEDAYYFAFLRRFGWVLDNFHSGYIEILSETGLLEYLLMVIITLRLIKRAREMAQFKFEYSTIFSFFIMFYVLNASETFFLRSTSFMQTTFLFFLIKAATRPLGSWSGPRQDPSPVHLERRSPMPAAATRIQGARP